MPTKWKVHKSGVAGSSFRSDSRHTTYDYKRRRDSELGPVASFRGSYRWQKVRKNQIQKNPVCYDPFKHHQVEGLPALAQSVHHCIGLLECLRMGQLERLGCVTENLRSLCNDCHNKVEGVLDRQGEETAKRIFLSEMEESAIIQLVLS